MPLRNTLSEEALDAIAARIKKRHRNDTKAMLATGEDLHTVKHETKHGQWGHFVEEKIGFSESKAKNYMNAYVWYQTLSPSDKIVVTTVLGVESVIALSRKGTSPELKSSILDLARAAKKDNKPFLHKIVQQRIAVERAAIELERLSKLPKPPTPTFPPLTKEDCLRLCWRLYSKLQPYPEPDPTLLRDLGRAVASGDEYIDKIFLQVMSFIKAWNLKRQAGVSNWNIIRPAWYYVKDESDQGEFEFSVPPTPPQPGPPGLSDPPRPVPEWAE